MSKSQIISVRITEDLHDEILLQAAKEGISKTEWLQRRIALMNVLQREKPKFLLYLYSKENSMSRMGTILGDPILKRAREFANIIP